MDSLIAERSVWLVAAIVIDTVFGELPNAFHPVAWFGRAAGFLFGRVPMQGSAIPFALGSLLTVLLTAASVISVHFGFRLFASVHTFAGDLFAIFVLQSTFAARALLEAGREVATRLREGATDGARRELGALCSRDATELDATALLTGATESVAENASDSVIAPLLAFVFFGLEGAVAYRCLNTLDAMFGYRDHREWLGKTAARLDDLANLLPARITALLMVVAGASLGCDAKRATRIWWRDHGLTPSPNGGHPMAMMAGLLGKRLDKPGVYALGSGLPSVDDESLHAALRIVGRTFLLAFAMALVGTELVHVL